MSKTILLTGVAGFIASKTAEFLLKQGHTVVGVDNMNEYYDVRIKQHRLKQLRTAVPAGRQVTGSYGTVTEQLHKKRTKNVTTRNEPKQTVTNRSRGCFTFHKIDIENRDSVQRLFKKYDFDVVVNLAARAGVRYSMENPHVYMTTNGNGTLNLLEGCREYGVKKFVLASTSSLYAGQKMPFLETLAVNTPISPYAASKKAAEVMAYSYSYLYGLDVSVVRYFTVYGPAGRPDMCMFRFIKWIDEGTPIEVFGDGSQSRDFTYVDDIARGTIKAMKKVGGFEVMNLGGGNKPYTLNYVIELIEEYLGKNATRVVKPFHIADIKSTWANIDKAKKILKWEPKIELEDGVRRSVEWYFENRRWLKDVEL